MNESQVILLVMMVLFLGGLVWLGQQYNRPR